MRSNIFNMIKTVDIRSKIIRQNKSPKDEFVFKPES